MNIYAIDDEKLALNALVTAIEEAVPDAQIYAFTKPSELIAAIPTTPCDVAFMDINMPGITGLDLAKKIKQVYPKVNIVFVTGYSEYVGDAMSLRASGYVRKPVTREKIEEEMQELRNPIVERPDDKKVFVQCFGNFEVFVDGNPVKFKRAKSKELFAYLIDRQGATCTMNEVAAVLWEDGDDSESMKKQLRVIVSDLRATMKSVGAGNVIIKEFNKIAVNVKRINCDYYMYNASPMDGINSYRGEYMSQYSWAEATNATILQIHQ